MLNISQLHNYKSLQPNLGAKIMIELHGFPPELFDKWAPQSS
jgi:hypothetical protein